MNDWLHDRGTDRLLGDLGHFDNKSLDTRVPVGYAVPARTAPRKEPHVATKTPKNPVPTLPELLPGVAKWLQDAYAHGRVYYLIERVSTSGMTRYITLWTVGKDHEGKPILNVLWPDHYVPEGLRHLLRPDAAPEDAFRVRMNELPRSWGNPFTRINWSDRRRCFKVEGGGMDMVFALLHELGSLFKMPPDFVNKVRHESLRRFE